MRGFFEIGIANGKTEHNLGTLWRSAYQLGATGIFTIGKRYKAQSSDTYKTSRHIPLREHADFQSFFQALPNSCPLIAVEMGGTPLKDFVHPERACYLLGAEDNGLSKEMLSAAHIIVSLPALRTQSFNVAVAGSIIMYDRFIKRG